MFDPKEYSLSIKGKGDPLFLVHGIGNTKHAWDYLLPTLTKKFTTITYDLCGHGNSPIKKNNFALKDLVKDLENIRKITGFEKGHFVGHSLGGMICPAYARKFPSKIKSLGLISTAAGRTKQDSDKVFEVINAMKKQGVEKILNKLINRWFTDGFIKNQPEIVNKRITQVLKTDEKIFLNVFKIYADTRMDAWLNEIKAPSLVLTGAEDAGCTPKMNKFISNKIKNSKLVILPKLKHSLLLEAPNKISNEIIKFMSKY
mgnify:FL=1|tara:strand:- start:1607 stop:2380 length:774 start_codon:yes stop_codon:yes gene_type:complete